MLTITIPRVDEAWDEKKGEFIKPVEKDIVLQLEHSLISLEKWEEKWKKPFLSKIPMTFEESLDYIRCMTITQNVNPNVYLCLTDEHVDMIHEYMNDKMSATWFRDGNVPPSRRVITSEVIYCWMIQSGIPFECQKWHFNRLLTLIRVVQEENRPTKKMTKAEQYNMYRQVNEARKAAQHSKG